MARLWLTLTVTFKSILNELVGWHLQNSPYRSVIITLKLTARIPASDHHKEEDSRNSFEIIFKQQYIKYFGSCAIVEFINVVLIAITSLHQVETGSNSKVHPDDLALFILLVSCLNTSLESLQIGEGLPSVIRIYIL